MPDREPDPVGGIKEPLWKRSLPILGSLVLVGFIFGWLLPQYIDYEAVFRSIQTIEMSEWAVLLAFAGLRILPESWIYLAALPGITQRRAVEQFLVTASLNNVPPGGLDLIVRYQMARSWGISPTGASTATVATWFFVTFPRFVLPVIATGLLTIRHIRDDSMDLLAIIGIVATVLLSVLFIVAVRSESFVLAVGRLISRLADFILGLFRKDSDINFESMAVKFRDEGLELVRRRWGIGFPAGLLAQFAQFLVLLLAVRFVGLDSVDWIVVFAAFAVVAIVGAIPIFNIPGIAEAVLIGILGAAVGGGATDEVAAAVFVFRILTWLLPIPLGGIAYSRWRTWASSHPSGEAVGESP